MPEVTVPSLYTFDGARKYPTADERLRFLAAAASHPPDDRAFCLVLTHNGCRISEALALTGRSIEIDAGVIAVRCLKKRTRAAVIRQIPIPNDLLQLLIATFPPIATTSTDRLWRRSRTSSWQLVKSVMAEARIPPGPHTTPKGLRHGFGLHAIRSGVPLNLVQRWLGHADISTTTIYLQALGPEERAFAARMWMDTDANGSSFNT